jgi:hypothetical protein
MTTTFCSDEGYEDIQKMMDERRAMNCGIDVVTRRSFRKQGMCREVLSVSRQKAGSHREN